MKYLLTILNWYRRTKQKCLDNYLDTFDPCLFLLSVVFFVGCTKTGVDDSLPEHLEPTECYYDSTALKENFDRANVYAKGKPPKPPRGNQQTGYSCIYIDFDGQLVNSGYWNGGNTINCLPAELTTEQKSQVVSEVQDLYDAYNVTITDKESVFLAANPNKRIRIIVTPTSSWFGGVSGISYLGQGTWGDNTPSFVFSDRLFNGPHYIAEIVSHEAGHCMANLRHQSEYNEDCTLRFTYKMGVVMGNSLYVPQGAWIYGTTTSCNTWQNDHQMLVNALGLAP